MRNKQTVDPMFDYSKSLFECTITKKQFLGNSRRYFYLFDKDIIINKVFQEKESKKRKPDHVLHIELIKRVIWKYSDNKSAQKKNLKGFLLDYFDKSLEYYADECVLLQLKKFLAQKLFQARVQDEYEAQCVIGQGNYALVLELKHLHSQVRLASKCIDKKKLESVDNGMKSVINEINIMRELSPHPQIVNLHEVYEGDNNMYLIMDLAEGGSLYQEMKNRKYLFSRKEIQQLMYRILSALAYMHSKGIMHRDLKPENILYQTKGDISTLKLADFGLSTFANDIPYLYPKCGTPGFVAPEVVNLENKQEGYDVKCDVFSAAVIFHVLLFGEGLFPGKGHTDILKQNKKCEFNLKHKKYDTVDPDARDLLFKMLEIDPVNRISSLQCIEHPYFSDETLPNTIPPLIRISSTDPSDFKIVPPGTQSPFHVYMASEEKKTPDNGLNILPAPPNLEKRNSIVTRTPIYKEKQIQPKDTQFSDFDLDRDQTTKTEEGVIFEEAKEQDVDSQQILRKKKDKIKDQTQQSNG